MNNHYKHHYDRSAPVVVVVHKLDSLYLFSDAFYTCRFSIGFVCFRALTPNIMRVVITLKMLNMAIKIIPGTFLIRKIAFAMWFSWEIVLHCTNIIMHTKDPSMHNEESKDSIPIILLDTASANAVLYLLYPIPRRLYHVEMPTMRARMA